MSEDREREIVAATLERYDEEDWWSEKEDGHYRGKVMAVGAAGGSRGPGGTGPSGLVPDRRDF